MMSKTLGKLETQFFAFVQSEGLRQVGTRDLVKALGLSPVQERKLLSRLCRAGLIARVRRGLYLVPSRLPPGGRWTPGAYLALNVLIEDQNGAYQICGPSAFSQYGWDDQVPNRVYAYNNRISGERQIGSVALSLIQIADGRLGGTEVVSTPDGASAVYSSRARSLMDAVYDWARFNTLPRAYQWIGTELAKDDAIAAELVDASLRYGNQGTIRRIGNLLDANGVQPSLVRRLEKSLRPTSSFIPWIPTRPKKGKTNKRWGVVINDDI